MFHVIEIGKAYSADRSWIDLSWKLVKFSYRSISTYWWTERPARYNYSIFQLDHVKPPLALLNSGSPVSLHLARISIFVGGTSSEDSLQGTECEDGGLSTPPAGHMKRGIEVIRGSQYPKQFFSHYNSNLCFHPYSITASSLPNMSFSQSSCNIKLENRDGKNFLSCEAESKSGNVRYTEIELDERIGNYEGQYPASIFRR